MSSIDFDKFSETVGLADVAKALGINSQRFHPTWTRTSCPVCRHDDFRCCHVNWEKNEWYCHRCKSGGGPIQLASLLLHLDVFDAVKAVCAKLGIPVPWRPRVRTRRRMRDASGEIIAGDEEEDMLE